MQVVMQNTFLTVMDNGLQSAQQFQCPRRSRSAEPALSPPLRDRSDSDYSAERVLQSCDRAALQQLQIGRLNGIFGSMKETLVSGLVRTGKTIEEAALRIHEANLRQWQVSVADQDNFDQRCMMDSTAEETVALQELTGDAGAIPSVASSGSLSLLTTGSTSFTSSWADDNEFDLETPIPSSSPRMQRSSSRGQFVLMQQREEEQARERLQQEFEHEPNFEQHLAASSPHPLAAEHAHAALLLTKANTTKCEEESQGPAQEQEQGEEKQECQPQKLEEEKHEQQMDHKHQRWEQLSDELEQAEAHEEDKAEEEEHEADKEQKEEDEAEDTDDKTLASSVVPKVASRLPPGHFSSEGKARMSEDKKRRAQWAREQKQAQEKEQQQTYQPQPSWGFMNFPQVQMPWQLSANRYQREQAKMPLMMPQQPQLWVPMSFHDAKAWFSGHQQMQQQWPQQNEQKKPQKDYRHAEHQKDYRHAHVPKTVDLAEEFSKQEGEIPKTTLMIRNIPNRYTQCELIQELGDLGFTETFDFLYIPLDKGTMSNVGYAFVNFLTPVWAQKCMAAFEGYRFRRHRHTSGKIATVSVAHLQGLEANVKHYQRTAVNNARLKQRRPVIMNCAKNFLGLSDGESD